MLHTVNFTRRIYLTLADVIILACEVMASVNSAGDDKLETIEGHVAAVMPVTAAAGSGQLAKSGEMLAEFDEGHDSAFKPGCPSFFFSPSA
jgi:hypothetical protein